MTDGVLADDGIATPVQMDPSANDGHELACDFPGCTTKARTKQGLGTHRWAAHGLRAGDKAPAASSSPSSGTSSPGGAGNKPPTPPPFVADKPLAQRLQGSIGLIGVGVGMFEPYDGAVIQKGAKSVAEALDVFCQQYPDARKYVEMICLDSPAIGLLLALLPIVLPILKHHGLLPAGVPLGPFAGPPDPKGARRDEHGQPDPSSPGIATLLGAAMADPGFLAMAGSMAASMQANAGAASPMGEGAPADVAPPPPGFAGEPPAAEPAE